MILIKVTKSGNLNRSEPLYRCIILNVLYHWNICPHLKETDLKQPKYCFGLISLAVFLNIYPEKFFQNRRDRKGKEEVEREWCWESLTGFRVEVNSGYLSQRTHLVKAKARLDRVFCSAWWWSFPLFLVDGGHYKGSVALCPEEFIVALDLEWW